MTTRLPEPLFSSLLEVIKSRGYSRSEEPFQLAAGGLSHDYVDMRRAVAHGADLTLAARCVVCALEQAEISYDAIGGMTMGADPIAHAIAVIANTKWFSVRKAEKDHGSKRRIEGSDIGEGVSIVAIEDTVSTGRSVIDAVDVIEKTGATIAAVLTILDRGDAAAKIFAERNIPYLRLYTYQDLHIDPIA